MSPPSERDVSEALAALTRLHRHGILPLEEAREAARLIARDDNLEFPPPEPRKAPNPAPTPPTEEHAGDNGSAPTPS